MTKSRIQPCPIMIRREGNEAVVEIDTGVSKNPWVEVIRVSLDGEFSHIVEPHGVEMAMQKHFNSKA